ncbi:MAG: hypothetical protein OSJ53_08260 [Kineothrix sp.]|nr:hypothetical protein C807_01875 [Lachnospiraceae bacterium 28-4]MCX4343862.1 hypothetical protein [Kineothrix sp.]
MEIRVLKYFLMVAREENSGTNIPLCSLVFTAQSQMILKNGLKKGL